MLSLLAAGAALAADFQVIDLGALTPRGSSAAVALNEAGQVAGWSDAPNGARHAFLWDPRTRDLVDLTPSGVRSSFPVGLSAAGAVAGTMVSDDGVTHAFLWRGGGLVDVTPGLPHSAAGGLNEVGMVVGHATFPRGDVVHAFAWDGQRVVDLGALGGRSLAVAINDAGEIAGASTLAPHDDREHAVYWPDPQAAPLDIHPEGATRSWATGIDANGVVAGVAVFGDTETLDFVWDADTARHAFFARREGVAIRATNAKGEMVGTAIDGAGGIRAGHWAGGAFTDLGTLGGTAAAATDINEAGLIAGTARLRGDATFHAFVAVPRTLPPETRRRFVARLFRPRAAP